MEHRAGRPGVPSAWLAERLGGPARQLGVELGPRALRQLARYAELVLEWGERINLTGARTREALVDEHLADALVVLPHLPAGPFRFVDVGSGAGLPGLVLASARPDARGLLLEPTRKKQAFLAHAVRELGLGERVEARAERLETHFARGGRGAWDVAISRATWSLETWLERGAPLVRPGGRVLGFEGAAEVALPAGATRYPYAVAGRRRALVVLAPP